MVRRTALAYPASPVAPAPPVDLTDRATRERLSGPALRAFFNVMARWQVRDDDARLLLGGVTNGPYYEMKRQPDRLLDVDRLTRVSLIIGIFKALGLLYSDALADRWVHLPNTNRLFAGATPLAYMMPRRRAGAADRPPPARRAPGRVMRLPPVTPIDQRDTHRLVPSRYSPRGESVLVRIADPGDDAHLAAIFELDGATNDRLLAERGLLPGIGPDELVVAVPLASVINAAFCHAHPLGSRFAGADRGAWYAGFEIETSHAEVAFHKSVELAEIGSPDESITYDDYQADFARDVPRPARRRRLQRLPLADELRRVADRWRRACSKPTRSAWSTRACGTRAAPAWRASGRRWSDACGAAGPGASRGRAARGRASRPRPTAARTRSAAAGRSRRRREHDRGGD